MKKIEVAKLMLELRIMNNKVLKSNDVDDGEDETAIGVDNEGRTYPARTDAYSLILAPGAAGAMEVKRNCPGLLSLSDFAV